MTIEEIKTAELETVEARALEIAGELETAEPETLDTLSAELDAIQERKAEIRAAAEEKRAAMRDAIDAAETIETVEKQEERKTMEKVEVRSTPEYLTAWVENIKGRASEEQRALLTQNATDGTIAVPTYVEDEIRTAWESNELLRRVRRTYFPGNLKVGYEISAPFATVHAEGGDAQAEENLQLGIVEMIPEMIKKWFSFSDEALDMRGEAFIDYAVDEVTDRVIKGVIKELLNNLMDDDSLAVYYQAGNPQNPITTGDIIAAAGLLSGEISDPVVITTRAQAAALKTAALSANYGYDPFDGMPVIYVDAAAMPSNNTNSVKLIVGDASAFQVNFPAGDDVKIKIDENTLMTQDMVRILGRVYAACAITKPSSVAYLMGGASEGGGK